jgi:hypothetical protein
MIFSVWHRKITGVFFIVGARRFIYEFYRDEITELESMPVGAKKWLRSMLFARGDKPAIPGDIRRKLEAIYTHNYYWRTRKHGSD